MVVPVLITSCQVSEYPKAGPETIHATTHRIANPNATGEPAHFVTRAAKWSKNRAIGFPCGRSVPEVGLFEDARLLTLRVLCMAFLLSP